MALKFDELNILESYFEPMAISKDDKARRIELANLLTDAILYFFMVYEVHKDHNSTLEKSLYEQLLNDRISDAVSNVTGIDGYISNHIRTLSKEVVNTTYKYTTDASQADSTPLKNPYDSLTALEHGYTESLDSPILSSDSPVQEEDALISKEDDEVEEIMEREAVTDYWLSIHRAVNIARNEANTILNYNDFVEAKEDGYTKKTWLTMLDPKVRDTHEEVEGQTIGIDEYFTVGNSQMRFPHDMELAPDPREVINCRCAIDYVKE